MPLSFSELKLGSILNIDGQPYQITWQNFQRTAQRKPVLQTKLRNLINGKVIEYSFKFGEKMEEADVIRRSAQFLYFDGGFAYFMDNESYETVSIPQDKISDAKDFLKDGLDCHLILFEGKPVKVELPVKVEYKIVSTAPGVKGDTATGGNKPAKIETGATVQVPLFIKEGETIRVNTQTGEYAERASS
ncbi:MAG: elongation factor P [Candidatus Doudnabacteria bacterium RIFCSPHIGHO2_02_FULL_46_11]|uniref:Elongation factor P n=1 Tax=Candidatus Doudnabacteria bacterium RIFCSPHIGHO2_02_FULL_46_11 TaxID=1817832 RepID=A0A1F5P8J4_9BACT|nr:MAG: elongation factor P [Candidatus Doudnabacteria bacterium RIFCSPHIGHO2_02_FULL_46_11]